MQNYFWGASGNFENLVFKMSKLPKIGATAKITPNILLQLFMTFVFVSGPCILRNHQPNNN